MALAAAAFVWMAAPAPAQHLHSPANGAGAQPPAPFVASTARPFSQLMDDAMALMEHGMRAAPMNGDPEHDFVAMMIPHHQGAIDMAKAVLLYTKDPALRNLALSIIAEQHNEIRLMQAWLARHAAGATGSAASPDTPRESPETTKGTP